MIKKQAGSWRWNLQEVVLQICYGRSWEREGMVPGWPWVVGVLC